MATKRTPKSSTNAAGTTETSAKRVRGDDVASTRLALLRAAERLMSEQDINSVSLREVSAAADQRNNSAVLYHFGSRDALIDAILERHSLPIHERWASQLDFIERQGLVGLRPLVELLVVEIVNKLDDADGGWAYISICSQLLLTPVKPLVERGVGNTPTVQRLIGGMLPHYAVPSEFLIVRFERLLHLIYAGLVAYRRLELTGNAPVSRELFTSELVDTVEAAVKQPLSAETLALSARQSQSK